MSKNMQLSIERGPEFPEVARRAISDDDTENGTTGWSFNDLPRTRSSGMPLGTMTTKQAHGSIRKKDPLIYYGK